MGMENEEISFADCPGYIAGFFYIDIRIFKIYNIDEILI